MRQYEVERRMRGHPPVPRDFELSLEGDINDTYFLVSPEGLGRVRRAVLYPTMKEIFVYGIKKPSGGVLVEQERRITRERYEELCRQTTELNPVVVSGHRRLYRSNGTAVCSDDIDQLGPWTEVEVLVRRKGDVPRALETVNMIMKKLGAHDADIVAETYPEMLSRMH